MSVTTSIGSESGITLIYTLLIALVMITAVVGSTAVVVREAQTQRLSDQGIQANYIAESVVERHLQGVRTTSDLDRIALAGDFEYTGGDPSVGCGRDGECTAPEMLPWTADVFAGPEIIDAVNGTVHVDLFANETFQIFPQGQEELGIYSGGGEPLIDGPFTIVSNSLEVGGVPSATDNLLEVSVVTWQEQSITADLPEEDVLSYADLPLGNLNVASTVYTYADLSGGDVDIDLTPETGNAGTRDYLVRFRALSRAIEFDLDTGASTPLGPEITIQAFASFRGSNGGRQASIVKPEDAAALGVFDYVLFAGGAEDGSGGGIDGRK